MKFTTSVPLSLNLSQSVGLNVEEPSGTTLRVTRGRVWLTQEGLVDDVFLDAGSGHTFRVGGRAVVSAERGAATIVFDTPLVAASREPFAATLRRLFTRLRAPAPVAMRGSETI